MAILSVLDDDEHWPEYGTLVVCDARPESGGEELPPSEGWLDLGAADVQPTGTIARSGEGWLEVLAADEYHRVRLEAHDAAPPDDRDGWDDVVELPYLSCTGRVGIGSVTGIYVDPSVQLGRPGLYRLRVARRPAGDVSGDVFRVQFWPGEGAGSRRPRWLRRHQAVLDGPPPAVLDARSALARYRSFVSDLVTVAMWSGPDARLTITLADLADLLLATVAQVRETLNFAISRGQLAVDDGDPADPLALVTLRVLPSQPPPERQPEPMALPQPGPPWDGSLVSPDPPPAARPEPAPVAPPEAASAGPAEPASAAQPTGPPAEYGWYATVEIDAPRRVPYLPPWGDPPASGFVGAGGEVVRWLDGAPVTIARWRPRRPDSPLSEALETAHGILLISSGEAVLVGFDGQTVPLRSEPSLNGVLAEDARHFAYVELHFGRRPYARLHLVDLADLSHQIMPADESDLSLNVLAVHRGVVHLSTSEPRLASMRWTPGTDPEPSTPTVRAVDSLTGTALAVPDEQPGVVVVEPDGRTRRVAAGPQVELGPGARLLCEFRHHPPAIVVHDLTDAEPAANVIWLPVDADVGAGSSLVWESSTRLLLRLRYGGGRLEARLLRVDLLTGAFERIALPELAGYDPLAIAPALS